MSRPKIKVTRFQYLNKNEINQLIKLTNVGSSYMRDRIQQFKDGRLNIDPYLLATEFLILAKIKRDIVGWIFIRNI